MSVDVGGFRKAARCWRLTAAIVMALVGLADGAFAQTPSAKDQSIVLTVWGDELPAALKRTIDTLEAGGRTVILRIAGAGEASLPRRPPCRRPAPLARSQRRRRHPSRPALASKPSGTISLRASTTAIRRFAAAGRTGRTRQGLGREPQRADGVAGLTQVDPAVSLSPSPRARSSVS